MTTDDDNKMEKLSIDFLPKKPTINYLNAYIIKPKKKLNNMSMIKPNMPFDITVVFTIKGLVDQDLNYISVSYLVHHHIPYRPQKTSLQWYIQMEKLRTQLSCQKT